MFGMVDAPDHLVVVEVVDVVVHVLLEEDGHTFVVALLGREHATAWGCEYQQMDA